jgi:acyl carrier protein
VNTAPDLARQVLATVTGRDMTNVADRDRLSDLGVDSLDRVLLAVLIEQHRGHPLPDDALIGVRTVADLHGLLQPEGSRP